MSITSHPPYVYGYPQLFGAKANNLTPDHFSIIETFEGFPYKVQIVHTPNLPNEKAWGFCFDSAPPKGGRPMPLYCDEVFGPTGTVLGFASPDDARVGAAGFLAGWCAKERHVDDRRKRAERKEA